MTEAYDHFREGQKRLRKGMTAQATVPLEKAKKLEPGKASIREAAGQAGRGKRALQARALDEARLRDLRRADQRPRPVDGLDEPVAGDAADLVDG
jgi:hypothetical protein